MLRHGPIIPLGISKHPKNVFLRPSMASNELLFTKYELRETLEQHANKARDVIAALSASQTEGDAGDSVVAELEKEYHVAPLVLLENGMTVEHEETKVDVSQDRMRTVCLIVAVPAISRANEYSTRYRSKETQ
jgi:hypothetical protein